MIYFYKNVEGKLKSIRISKLFSKLIYIFILIIIFYLSIINIPETNYILLKFDKDNREIDYYSKFQQLTNQYSKDPFYNSFLKEISITSYDYSKLSDNNNTKVNIMINLNNKYIYPTIISINSALKNLNKSTTILVYHVLHTKDLKIKYMNMIKSFLYIYPRNLEFIFYNMGNCFIQFKSSRLTQVTYYRLISPIFIPLDRIIYLDSDVLVLKDLKEMYILNFHNNYILGYLDFLADQIDYLGVKSEKYINAGVTLINLNKIRKDNKNFELLYMATKRKKLKNQDQTVINYILYPKIGILPFKYGIFNFPSIFDIKYIYLRIIRQELNFNEILTAFKDPSLMHFVLCYPKPWNANTKYLGTVTRNGTLFKDKCEKFHKMWMEYSIDTNYYKEKMKQKKMIKIM